MRILLTWEHNGDDSLLYVQNYPGAYARGRNLQEALDKIPAEVHSYCRWAGLPWEADYEVEVTEEKISRLRISDADSDVIFEAEKEPLTHEEYERLKELALHSARTFEALYQAIPDKHRSALKERETFYGKVPRTAAEMYSHTRQVNSYYFGEIQVEADNEGSLEECRRRGFENLEKQADFLKNRVFEWEDETWSLRKVLRRFIWHDRIHARAMWRMACKTFEGFKTDTFGFEEKA